MTNIVDNQNGKALRLREFVVKALSESPSGTLSDKALLSFRSSVSRHGLESLDEDGLLIWVSDMILSGLKQSTRKRYFNSLHSQCRSVHDFSHSDPFENVRSELNRDYVTSYDEARNNLGIVGKILRKSSLSVENDCYDIFLCLLYDVNASLQDIIRLSFGEASNKLPQIEDIADARKVSGRSKYVFGLRQGQVRDRQICREVISTLSSLLRSNGMKFSGSFSRDSIKEMWICAALESGVTTDEIRSVVASLPEGFSFLEMVRPLYMTDAEKSVILRKVADHINDNTCYWYAMRLRAGKTPSDVKSLLQTEAPSLYNRIRFYYPTHEVVREGRGGRRIREELPYLPGILFFYVRREEVGLLFSRYLGSLAWCYRYSASPDSPYSSISRREMELFQRHIGSFTDDIRVDMVTLESPLSVNDIVTVYGGVMDGSICTITGVKNQNGTRTYTLQLTSQTSFRWTVSDVDELRLERCTFALQEAY